MRIYIRPPRSFLSLLITITRLPPRRKKGWQGGTGVCLFLSPWFLKNGKGSILGSIYQSRSTHLVSFWFWSLFIYFFLFHYSPSRSLFLNETHTYIYFLVLSRLSSSIPVSLEQKKTKMFPSLYVENDTLHLRQSFSRVSWAPATLTRLCF